MLTKIHSKNKLPNFAIITVTKEDFKGVSTTNKSLIKQKYSNWIHLIVDGKSSAKTVSKLRKLSSKRTLVISESDSGIYDAMNKAWRLAPESAWLIFLNGGDYLIDSGALKRISNEILRHKESKVFIAPFEEKDADGDIWRTRLVAEPNPLNQLFCYSYASHQGMVIQKKVFVELSGFDESLKVAADWELYLRAIEKFPSTRINYSFSCFELGGYSTQYIHLAHRELRKVRRKMLDLTFKQKLYAILWESLYLPSYKSRSLLGNVFYLFIGFLRIYRIFIDATTKRFIRFRQNFEMFEYVFQKFVYKRNSSIFIYFFRTVYNLHKTIVAIFHLLLGYLKMPFSLLMKRLHFMKRQNIIKNKRNSLKAKLQEQVLKELDIRSPFSC